MAGISLLGHPDGPAVTTRAVCRESTLTQRYFYDSFDDCDSFVAAAYERAWRIVRTIAVRNVSGLTDRRQIIQASVRAWMEVIETQPAVVRTILQAPETEQVLKEPAIDQRSDAERLVVSVIDDIDDPLAKTIIARSVWGSLRTLFISYMNGEIDCTAEEFEIQCVAMVARLLT